MADEALFEGRLPAASSPAYVGAIHFLAPTNETVSTAPSPLRLRTMLTVSSLVTRRRRRSRMTRCHSNGRPALTAASRFEKYVASDFSTKKEKWIDEGDRARVRAIPHFRGGLSSHALLPTISHYNLL